MIMNHYRTIIFLPLFLTVKLIPCQSHLSTATQIPKNIFFQETTIDDNNHYDDFCDYFYSKDTLNDTLHFKFENREDFGPVYLSDNELKQLYSEIKRGNTDAYEIICHHFFYSYSEYISISELDKLICITDYLAQK